jgi:hypothetical protein
MLLVLLPVLQAYVAGFETLIPIGRQPSGPPVGHHRSNLNTKGRTGALALLSLLISAPVARTLSPTCRPCHDRITPCLPLL